MSSGNNFIDECHPDSSRNVINHPEDYMSDIPPTLLCGAGGSGKIVVKVEADLENPMNLICGTASSGKTITRK